MIEMNTPTPAAQALIEKLAAVSMDANPDDLLPAPDIPSGT